MAYLVAIVLAVFVIAALWAAESGIQGFSLDHSIRPLEIATLGVNIFIAFFLQYYFASRSRDLRAEKDMLIDTVRDILRILRSCRDALAAYQDDSRNRNEHKRSVLQLFRRLSNGLDGIDTAIGASQCKALQKSSPAIRESYLYYKRAATDGSFPARRFTVEEFSIQEQNYRKLNRDLEELVFKINQYR